MNEDTNPFKDVYEPCALSEELWGLLEDAGVDEATCIKISSLLDEAVANTDLFLDAEQLLGVAALCIEFSHNNAIFFLCGENVGVEGNGYIDTILKAAGVLYNKYGPEQVDAAEQILVDLGKDDKFIEKVVDIFFKVKRTFHFKTAQYAAEKHTHDELALMMLNVDRKLNDMSPLEDLQDCENPVYYIQRAILLKEQMSK